MQLLKCLGFVHTFLSEDKLMEKIALHTNKLMIVLPWGTELMKNKTVDFTVDRSTTLGGTTEPR